MTKIEDLLLLSIAQRGDRYVFGAEAAKSNPNPTQFDCSELVEWACDRAGLVPSMPDGAFNQWRHTRAAAVTVAVGMRTRGALLFVGDGTGTGRAAITHVAWSLGDGTTIEARGTRWGVGVFPSVGRFNFAAKIPGANYARPAVPPTKVPSGRPVLRRGSRGAHVTFLQTVLRKRGFRGADGRLIAVDGAFGPNTQAVVVAIQKWTKLKPDGIVGPSTWAVIDTLAR